MYQEYTYIDNSEKKSGLISTVFKVIITFGYIYNSVIVGLLTCENLAIILGFLFVAFSKRKLNLGRSNYVLSQIKPIMLVAIFALIYCEVLVLLFGTDKPHETVPWYLAMLFIYGITAFIVFINLFEGIEDLLRVILIVSVIQGLIVLAGMFIPSVADWIDNFYLNSKVGWDYAYMRLYGYPGGINCITSTGSMQLSLGLVACLYYINKNERSNRIFIFIYLFLSVCATAVGRTGLVVSILGLLYLLIISNSTKKIKIVGMVFAIAIAAVFIASSLGFTETISEQFMRLLNLKDNGLRSSFLDYYWQSGEFEGENGIPALTWKTIVGTGITSGTSGNGVYVNADGGFFRLYAGMGLPLALLFYFVFFRKYVNICRFIDNARFKAIGWFFLVYLVVGELKEPFIIFKRYPVIIIAVFFYFAYKNGFEESIEEI